ncbi:PHYLLO, chloroplastic-like protein [Drosera capensis]
MAALSSVSFQLPKEQRILNEFFYYNHTISISKLCAAHGVLHFCTQKKAELQEALLLSEQADSDCVIEVESSIDKNAAFHSFLTNRVGQVATQTFNFLSSPFIPEAFQGNLSLGKIHGIKYLLYSAQLNAPPTSVSLNGSTTSFCRQGFVLAISLEDGVGYGEPSSIMPSVRRGLEMAILNAFASRQSSSLLSVLHAPEDEVTSCSHSGTRICALLNGEGAPVDVANASYDLVHEGFCSLKLKVARRRDPVEDAVVVQEIRKRVGPLVELRVDANLSQEPVHDEDDIIRFCEESDLPVALDETINNIHGDILVALGRFTHPGIVALVIKPSLVGGFENAAEIARWAHVQGKMAVQNVDITRALDKKLPAPVPHGLGTYRWLKEDVGTDTFKTSHNPCDGGVEASIYDADQLLLHFEINQRVILRSSSEARGHTYVLNLETEDFLYSVEVQEIGERWHGRCITVNLPGHGKSQMQYHRVKGRANRMSIRVVLTALCKLIDYVSASKATFVGYSMVGRIALFMALKFGAMLDGAIIISGSPGLQDATARKMRPAKDDGRARSLASHGLKSFLESWYLGDLWSSFREHPSFEQIVERRLHQHQDYTSLAKALSDLTIGRQPVSLRFTFSSSIPFKSHDFGLPLLSFLALTFMAKSEVIGTERLEVSLGRVEAPRNATLVHPRRKRCQIQEDHARRLLKLARRCRSKRRDA